LSKHLIQSKKVLMEYTHTYTYIYVCVFVCVCMYKEHENGHLRLYTHYLIYLMYNPFSSYTSAEYDSTLALTIPHSLMCMRVSYPIHCTSLEITIFFT